MSLADLSPIETEPWWANVHGWVPLYYAYRLHPGSSREGLRNAFQTPDDRYHLSVSPGLYLYVYRGIYQYEMGERDKNHCEARRWSNWLELTPGEYFIGPYQTQADAIEGASLVEEAL